MNKRIVVLVCISVLYPVILLASMNDYCSTPPFLTTAVKSNALLVMDFSGSMQFPAYYGCGFHGYYSSKVAKCGYDGEVYANYNPNITYYGYFDPNEYYRYNSSGKYWEVNPSCTNTDRIGSGNCISGNLLNWLVMTRIDVALKALIGGKASCDTNYCYLRPQGSRRYVRSRNLHCKFHVRPKNYSSGSYSSKDILISAQNYLGTCRIGTFSNRYARVKIDKSERIGIIQNNFNIIRFGFMVFASNRRYGEIRYGFDENDLNTLISKMQNEVPYWGTPTGEALWEAYDYLRQYNSHGYESNYSYIRRGTVKDPYYQQLSDGSVVPVRCRKNFVVLISDGEWNGRVDPVRPAYYLHTTDLRSDLSGTQTAKVYTLFAFSTSQAGQNSMKTVSAFGSFKELNGCRRNWPYTFSGFPGNSRYVSFPRPNCNPSSTYRSCCDEWDEVDHDGVPDSYYAVTNGAQLQDALSEILKEMIKEASSGTAASILSKQAEAGSSLIQAIFYPQKRFGTGANAKDLNWVGYLYDWWLYTGRVAGGLVNNIREDTIENKYLDICEPDGTAGGDYIMEYIFQDGQLRIDAYKSNVSGQKADTSPETTYSSLDEAHPVWEAGDTLCQESAPLTNRKIYVVTGDLEPSSPVSSMTELKDLNNTSTKKYSKLFGDDDGDGDIDESGETHAIATEISFATLKRYIYGLDGSGTRRRQTNTGDIWKLGDIIYSTPKIVNYRDYSVVFTGGNDGMLHAFKLGKLRYDGLGAYQQVKLRNSRTDDLTDELGKELWSFIPKNAFPYLRFLADPNYCHLYYVDLSPYIIELDTDEDGSIDKRILIGGMRLGGATGCSGTYCVNPPADTCPTPSNYRADRDPSTTPSGCLGLSSYFALDITSPDSPKFLWEFTNPDLGFTYSGPAFIKRKDTSGSYHYYLMFVSGPTTYNGSSSQDLRVFILTLNDDFTISSKVVIDGNNSYGISGFSHKKDPDLSSFNNSFGGRLFTNGIDYNDDGNTDMVFFGVTKGTGSSWRGNLIGVKTNDIDPLNWDFIKVFNSATKPITAKVEYMKCFNMNYIFFGTGRYFFKEDDPGRNSADKERLYGIKIDECLQGGTCNINSSHSSSNVCSALIGGGGSQLVSWYQMLDPRSGDYYKERNISDPSVTDVDVIFFSTTEPTSDLCGYGGRSRMWGLNCATGEALDDQNCAPYIVRELEGTTYLQTSIGKITPYPISIGGNRPQHNPFQQKRGKATPWTPGVTPESPTPFYSPSSGSSSGQGEILYWIEH